MSSATWDLTEGSLRKHIQRLAIPASVGYFFNTMYNVVDTFWAGKLSTDSLAALSLNFPLFMLVMSLGIGFSSGSGSLIANSLGAKEKQKSRVYHTQAISLTAISSLIGALLLLYFLRPLFVFLKAEENVLQGAISYGRVIVWGMPIINLTPVVSAGLTAKGDTITYRNALIGGFLLNIALDPLFMYTFNLGEAGVALATIMIQLITLIYMTKRLIKSGGLKGIKGRDFIPQKVYIKEIIGQAVPATANFLTMSAGVFVITWFISSFGKDAVAAYGAAVRVEQIALVPTIGLNMALAAITGQNNGAGKLDRVDKSFKISLIGGLIIMGVILPPVLIWGKSILGLFTESERVISMGYNYLLLQGITYYSYIILFQSNSVLQGLKKPAMIMWMGLYRQILAPAVIFYLLCFSFGMEEKGVWRGLILINWSAALFTLLWARKVIHKSQLTQNSNEIHKTEEYQR